MRLVIGAIGVMVLVMVLGLSLGPWHKEAVTELYFQSHNTLPKTWEVMKEYPFAWYVGDRGEGEYYYGMIVEQAQNSKLSVPAYSVEYPYKYSINTENGTRNYYYFLNDTLPAERRTLNRTQTAPMLIEVVVVNHEGFTEDYEVEFVAQYGEKEVLLAYGKITLQDGQAQPVRATVRLTESFGRAKIVARLVDRSQEIHYWVTEKTI